MRQYISSRSPVLRQWFAAGIIAMALHALVWYGLRSSSSASTPVVISRIEVALIAPSQPGKPVAPRVETQFVEPRQVQTLKSSPTPPVLSNTPVLSQTTVLPLQNDSAPPVPANVPVPASVPAQDRPASQKAAGASENEPLTAPQFNAAYLHNPTPVYPAAARRTGYEGTVVIRARIQIDGSADRVEIKKSSGYGVLDQAALEAVRKWRFIPARRGNEAVVEWVDIPLKFKLEEE